MASQIYNPHNDSTLFFDSVQVLQAWNTHEGPTRKILSQKTITKKCVASNDLLFLLYIFSFYRYPKESLHSSSKILFHPRIFFTFEKECLPFPWWCFKGFFSWRRAPLWLVLVLILACFNNGGTKVEDIFCLSRFMHGGLGLLWLMTM